MLGSFATPHLLNLIATERKDEIIVVLRDVSCERHGEIKVQ